VKEVRWESSGTELAVEYKFFCGKENENHELGTGSLCKRESLQRLSDSDSAGMSYITLKCRWCHIIVLNVYAPKEHKTDGVKDSFWEESERVIYKFPKYHMKILLGDFKCQSRQG
jgi:hypothetical protein